MQKLGFPLETFFYFYRPMQKPGLKSRSVAEIPVDRLFTNQTKIIVKRWEINQPKILKSCICNGMAFMNLVHLIRRFTKQQDDANPQNILPVTRSNHIWQKGKTQFKDKGLDHQCGYLTVIAI
jgi:hypothetical protein